MTVFTDVKEFEQKVGYIPEVELDVGIVNKKGFDEWTRITEALRDAERSMGLESCSGGTGFGVRDTQWVIPRAWKHRANEFVKYLEQHMKKLGFEVEYCCWNDQLDYDIDEEDLIN